MKSFQRLTTQDGSHPEYNHLFHLTEHEVIPVRHILYRGDQPHLMVMEMQPLIKEDDIDPDGLFEQRYNVDDESQINPPQRYHRSQWERVFTVPVDVKISPVIINKAISTLFLLEQHLRPKYILLLAGNVVFLLEQEKWFRGSSCKLIWKSYFRKLLPTGMPTTTMFYDVQDALDGRKKAMRSKIIVDDNLPLRGFLITKQKNGTNPSFLDLSHQDPGWYKTRTIWWRI